jgi:predicted deacylase
LSDIRVGEINVKTGTKKKGFIKIAETSTFELKLPFHIINGKKSGPTLAIIAGIHPVEYPPMEGTIRLANELDPEEVSGTLITVPVLHLPGFQVRVPGSPLERTPLTSSFPGKPDGTLNERTAHFITNEIISKSDYVIETHGCNFQETCPNHIIMQRTGDDNLDKGSLMFARCFETKYVRRAMSDHAVTIPDSGNSVMTQSLKMKVPAVLPEVGSAGGISSKTGRLNEKHINWFMDGMKNFMKHIGMLKGEAILYDPFAVKNVLHFRAKVAGWFYPMRENGAEVSKDEVIGEIRDFFGEVKEQIIAPVGGVISLIWTRPAVDQGSILLQMFELGPKVSTLFN